MKMTGRIDDHWHIRILPGTAKIDHRRDQDDVIPMWQTFALAIGTLVIGIMTASDVAIERRKKYGSYYQRA